MTKPPRSARTQGERIAVAEERIDALEQWRADAREQQAEILDAVRALSDRFTYSRGAVIGAMGVISALVGVAAFFWHGVIAFIDAILHPR